MKRLALSFALLLPLTLLGCEKGETAVSTEAAQVASAPLTDDAVDQSPVPVKEDFEEEAAKTIDEDNVEDVIDKLEAEITNDAT
jgi:hypothetical protein